MKASVQIVRGIESLFGTRDENIRLIENGLKVSTQLIDNRLEIEGEPANVSRAESILEDYAALVCEGHAFNNGDLNSYLRVVTEDPDVSLRALVSSGRQRSFGKKVVAPKTINQRRYLEAIERNDLVFGVGPAGTGKTYLAVAMAVWALTSKRVSRIILTRPAVEAGERLGFLPGTLQEKVDPYLRPLYDALHDMLEPDKVEKLLERLTIEVAPIAFMRGRTLNDSFIILDEAQNSTAEQMKMVLTRQGFNSKMVVNGDNTQIDLPSDYCCFATLPEDWIVLSCCSSRACCKGGSRVAARLPAWSPMTATYGGSICSSWAGITRQTCFPSQAPRSKEWRRRV